MQPPSKLKTHVKGKIFGTNALLITVIHINNIFEICELIISLVIFYTITLLQVKYPLKNPPLKIFAERVLYQQSESNKQLLIL